MTIHDEGAVFIINDAARRAKLIQEFEGDLRLIVVAPGLDCEPLVDAFPMATIAVYVNMTAVSLFGPDNETMEVHRDLLASNPRWLYPPRIGQIGHQKDVHSWGGRTHRSMSPHKNWALRPTFGVADAMAKWAQHALGATPFADSVYGDDCWWETPAWIWAQVSDVWDQYSLQQFRSRWHGVRNHMIDGIPANVITNSLGHPIPGTEVCCAEEADPWLLGREVEQNIRQGTGIITWKNSDFADLGSVIPGTILPEDW